MTASPATRTVSGIGAWQRHPRQVAKYDRLGGQDKSSHLGGRASGGRSFISQRLMSGIHEVRFSHAHRASSEKRGFRRHSRTSQGRSS